MANPAVADQPSMYTLDRLRELSDEESHLAMMDAIGASPKGSEVVLPLTDGETVRYVWDGDTYLFRADTKAAEVLRKAGERQVVGRG